MAETKHLLFSFLSDTKFDFLQHSDLGQSIACSWWVGPQCRPHGALSLKPNLALSCAAPHEAGLLLLHGSVTNPESIQHMGQASAGLPGRGARHREAAAPSGLPSCPEQHSVWHFAHPSTSGGSVLVPAWRQLP